MNIDRVSPRQYQPTAQRRVTFNPVMQVKTFTSSDPINATRSTLHASRLESSLKTAAPRAKKVQVEQKPEKPPPRPIYQTPETPAKAAGRAMAWCAIGSLLLIPAFGPGALVITGICAFVSALYFIQHNRQIYQGLDHEDRTHFASTNRSLSDQPSTGRTTPRPHHVAQHGQPARAHNQSRTNGASYEPSQSRTAQPSHYSAHTYTRPSAGRQTKRV
jgi:hypothetical protein